MEFTTLIPNVFYADAQVGLQLFVECLQFRIRFQDTESGDPFYVLEKDGLKLHLIQSLEFASKDRPELRLETKNIEEVFQSVQSRFPALLHPNLPKPTLRPWGAREFGLRDASNVCVIIQQW
ncbi:MAG TPA: hypothetical protein VG842_06945 [Sediminibacterium sp.]|nr:hypothetical protein [Sediminibacterium sp.]